MSRYDGARQHLCPACGKRRLCTAENVRRSHNPQLPARPVWECVYPEALPCPPCAREGRSGAKRAV